MGEGAPGSVSVAHVGDSQLLICNGGRVEYQTSDHAVDGEVARQVTARGGVVWQSGGVNRIYTPGLQHPGLTTSRTLGDFEAQGLGVTSDPEIRSGLPLWPDGFILVASHGVWKVITTHDALQCVRQGGTCDQMARRVAELSRARWEALSSDKTQQHIEDTTAVVVRAVRPPARVV